MYFMLVGKHPFNGSFFKERITDNILNRPLQLPAQVRVPHSDELSDLITKLLEKDPDDRLSNANAILNHPWFTNEELDCYIDVEKIYARTEKPVAPDSFFAYSNMELYSLKPTKNKFRESRLL